MEALSYAFSHWLVAVVFFILIGSLLAALAWGRSGAITALMLAPSWGAAAAVSVALVTKPANVAWEDVWAHLHILAVVRFFLMGTATWLVASIPSTLTGLAIRAIVERIRAVKKSN
jgi:hypothetical protein